MFGIYKLAASPAAYSAPPHYFHICFGFVHPGHRDPLEPELDLPPFEEEEEEPAHSRRKSPSPRPSPLLLPPRKYTEHDRNVVSLM